MDIVLVHGYNVTSTRTYGVLPQRLKSAGHTVRDLYLAKYVTLDDDISLPDLIRAFNAALKDVYGAGFAKAKFACITHSTGGVVARAWQDFYYGERIAASPMTHLIMLAPPNNGSRLAELGKSRLSRLRSLVGIEPGLRVLDALELGSVFQWDLNTSWLRRKLHLAPKSFTFVITGQWIDKKLWDSIVPATYERGSDGVVRASAANLNLTRLTVAPGGVVTRERMDGVAYLITPRTAHADKAFGIIGSIPESGDHPVLSAILLALAVRSRADYKKVESVFRAATDSLQAQEPYHDGSRLDRYCQLVFRVSDTRGEALRDYAIELLDGTMSGMNLPSGFFGDKHQNEINPEKFVYYLNFDRMRELRGGRFGFRVQCAVNTTLVRYADTVFLGKSDVESILRPNETTLVDVILDRQLNKNLFRLTTDISEQKITGDAGEDWVE